MRKTLALTAASGIAITSLVALAPAASAKDGDVKMRNACTSTSSYAVKVKDRKGGERVDFWIKSNTVGESWTLKLTAGGAEKLNVTKQTRADDDDSSDDSRHTAEAKWRTFLPSGLGALTFTATGPSGSCTVVVPARVAG
jgi:hypothetical protein